MQKLLESFRSWVVGGIFNFSSLVDWLWWYFCYMWRDQPLCRLAKMLQGFFEKKPSVLLIRGLAERKRERDTIEMFRFWHCEREVRYRNFSLQGHYKVSLFAKYFSQDAHKSLSLSLPFQLKRQDEGKSHICHLVTQDWRLTFPKNLLIKVRWHKKCSWKDSYMFFTWLSSSSFSWAQPFLSSDLQ